jgi:hypothetical protein
MDASMAFLNTAFASPGITPALINSASRYSLSAYVINLYGAAPVPLPAPATVAVPSSYFPPTG